MSSVPAPIRLIISLVLAIAISIPGVGAVRGQQPPSDERPASVYVGTIQGLFRSSQVFSHALGRDIPYFIYLPPAYGRSGRLYPVLYMLHGNSGSREEWVVYGLIDHVDALITAGEIPPMIVVLPQGDFSYWVNLVPDGPAYGEYLVNDLVQHVDATYRVRLGPDNRAVGGLSMGGTRALIAAFRNPHVFGVVGAQSPALPEEGQRYFLGLRRDFRQRDPVTQAMRADQLSQLAIWVDVGDEDPWLARAEELHAILDDRDIPHEWHVFPGEHWGGYWTAHIPDYLRFYGAALDPRSVR